MRLLRLPLALVFALALLSAADASAATKQLVYYGGRVVSNPQVVVVSWGPNVDAQIQNGMPGFYTAILNSPYLDWVSEYSTVGVTASGGGTSSNQRIGRGKYLSSVTITPSNTATTLATSDIKTELEAQIAAGHLPAPVVDASGNANTVYMVNFPPGLTITANGAFSCQSGGFCSIQDTLVVGGKNVAVGLIPDQSTGGCAAGCGNDANYFNNATGVHAYELLDILTTPDIAITSAASGWYDSTNGRISDLCFSASGQHAVIGSYTVSKGWSNKLAACIAEVASLPVCDGGTTYCEQCTAAAQCGGAHPACETDATNAAIGECVACAASSDCSGTTPVCTKGGTANDTCAACTSDTQCSGNAAGPHCLASGACGAAAGTDGGTGGGGKSGCSTSGGFPSAVPAVLVLAALALRRRARPVARVRARPS
jgi:hypothetical protein